MGTEFLEINKERSQSIVAVSLPVGVEFDVRVESLDARYKNERGESYVKPIFGLFGIGEKYKARMYADCIMVFDLAGHAHRFNIYKGDWRRPNTLPPFDAFFSVVTATIKCDAKTVVAETVTKQKTNCTTFSITVTGTIGEDGQIDITTEATGAPIVTFIGALEVAKRDLYKQGGRK
jgi:hypothetical protein